MMELKKLEYERSWENSADFPTFQDSEMQVRADMQYHPNVIRDHINEMVDELTNAVGAPGGLASLDEDGKVPEESIPAVFAKGEPGGVAELDETGKVPESQLPGSYVGMESFNGRSGKVLPEKGDYDSSEVTTSATTASLFGLGEDATVDDTFGVLSEAALVKTAPQFTQVSLGGLAEGTILQFNENGSPVDFYIAKHNYEPGLNGEGRTLLVRKDCYDRRVWNSSKGNAYADSGIDAWLNGDYKALLDADVLAQIGETEFYYTIGNGDATVTTLSRPVFLLSLTEYGQASSYANVEGSALPTAGTLLVAYDSAGSASSHWTRSASQYDGGTTFAYSIGSAGSFTDYGTGVSNKASSRPAFTLPATYGEFFLDEDGVIHAKQFYVTTFTDIGGKPVDKRVETGSYVGTGETFVVSGTVDRKGSLTFSFEPKLVLITGGGAWGIFNRPSATGYGNWQGNNSDNYYFGGIQWVAVWGANQLQWYYGASYTEGGGMSNNDRNSLNKSGKTYNYIAIG